MIQNLIQRSNQRASTNTNATASTESSIKSCRSSISKPSDQTSIPVTREKVNVNHQMVPISTVQLLQQALSASRANNASNGQSKPSTLTNNGARDKDGLTNTTNNLTTAGNPVNKPILILPNTLLLQEPDLTQNINAKQQQATRINNDAARNKALVGYLQSVLAKRNSYMVNAVNASSTLTTNNLQGNKQQGANQILNILSGHINKAMSNAQPQNPSERSQITRNSFNNNQLLPHNDQFPSDVSKTPSIPTVVTTSSTSRSLYLPQVSLSSAKSATVTQQMITKSSTTSVSSIINSGRYLHPSSKMTSASGMRTVNITNTSRNPQVFSTSAQSSPASMATSAVRVSVQDTSVVPHLSYARLQVTPESSTTKMSSNANPVRYSHASSKITPAPAVSNVDALNTSGALQVFSTSVQSSPASTTLSADTVNVLNTSRAPCQSIAQQPQATVVSSTTKISSTVNPVRYLNTSPETTLTPAISMSNKSNTSGASQVFSASVRPLPSATTSPAFGNNVMETSQALHLPYSRQSSSSLHDNVTMSPGRQQDSSKGLQKVPKNSNQMNSGLPMNVQNAINEIASIVINEQTQRSELNKNNSLSNNSEGIAANRSTTTPSESTTTVIINCLTGSSPEVVSPTTERSLPSSSHCHPFIPRRPISTKMMNLFGTSSNN